MIFSGSLKVIKVGQVINIVYFISLQYDIHILKHQNVMYEISENVILLSYIRLCSLLARLLTQSLLIFIFHLDVDAVQPWCVKTNEDDIFYLLQGK